MTSTVDLGIACFERPRHGVASATQEERVHTRLALGDVLRRFGGDLYVPVDNHLRIGDRVEAMHQLIELEPHDILAAALDLRHANAEVVGLQRAVVGAYRRPRGIAGQASAPTSSTAAGQRARCSWPNSRAKIRSTTATSKTTVRVPSNAIRTKPAK